MKNLIAIFLILFPMISFAQFSTETYHENSIVNSKGERIYPESTKYKQPACTYSLEKFFSKNVKYPVEALRNKIEGKVFVKFIVDSTGKIINPIIIKGLGYGFDEEVLRVFQLMPDWEPGYSDGKPTSF